MDRKILYADSTCDEMVGGAVVQALHRRAVVVTPSWIALTLAVHTSAVLGAFHAVLFLGVGVSIARRAWASLRQAICAIPTHLADALTHLADAMPAAIAQTRCWRESPYTLGKDWVKYGLEGLDVAVRSAYHADILETQGCSWLRADIDVLECHTLAERQTSQRAAEL